MQEFFFTVLAIWFVWRLFSSFSGSKPASQNFRQTNNNYYSEPKKPEGEVRIETKATPESKIPPTEGEYVDYEDVK
ncbi:MAG: hypothetical protein NT084_15770 [Bacteroidetes bacterium]|jgi:hypothetical protein|nr:hypothetical protein [Bacteroidota bacterium]